MYLGVHFCHLGCPLCPPDSGGGGGGSGGDSGDGDSNTQTESSTSSSSTSDESAAFTVFAMGTTYFADPLPTTDALDALEAIASAEANLMQSLYGSEISFAETATDTMVITSTPTAAATTTTSPTGFAYTYTESNGDIVACPTEILVDLNGNTYASTVCVSPTTIGTAAPTYIFTSTQPSGGATLGCVSDLVLVEANQSPSTICVDWVTISAGTTPTKTTSLPPTSTAAATPCVTVSGSVSDGLTTQFYVKIHEGDMQTCSFTCEGMIDDCTGDCIAGYAAEADTGTDFISKPMTVSYSAPYGTQTFAAAVYDWSEENCCGGSIPCSCYSVDYYGTFLNC